jgi:tight adherence protein C
MSEETLLILAVFGAAAAGVYALVRRVVGEDDVKLRDRLGAGGGAVGAWQSPHAHEQQPQSAPPRGQPVVPLISRIGQAASQPFMPKTREKQSTLRRDLARAGLYSPQAARAVTGFKLICLVLGVVGGYVLGGATDQIMMATSFGGLLGYLLPAMWLRLRIQTNQRDLTYGLPDALDLLVVCVEAGLTMDAAMQRVGQELVIAHAALSREMEICHLETRVGLSRAESLRNLGARTGNAGLQSLAAMLTQAERFGTSVAQALRVHAESLRIARQHAAEELAAKASVKLTFPLVLFIFPSTFIVLAGPTVVALLESPLFK